MDRQGATIPSKNAAVLQWSDTVTRVSLSPMLVSHCRAREGNATFPQLGSSLQRQLCVTQLCLQCLLCRP